MPNSPVVNIVGTVFEVKAGSYDGKDGKVNTVDVRVDTPNEGGRVLLSGAGDEAVSALSGLKKGDSISVLGRQWVVRTGKNAPWVKYLYAGAVE